MIRFKKYESIENTFDRDFLELVRLEDLDKQEYVVQEKVHGSNTCFVTDGNTVNFGKRSGFMEDGEKFYEYEELLARYESKVMALFSIVKEHFPDIVMLTVFGEMFGGNYPHPDVKRDTSVTIMQKGVFYCPYHEFYAFDLYVADEKKGRYLTVDESNSFFEQVEFFYAKTLFRGDFDKCLRYPNDSMSLISEWLGLPPIEDNVCEGIVIRPVVTTYMSDGCRVMLKNKNARFAEKKSVKKREPKLIIEHPYSEELTNLFPIVEQYITENRLGNVVSKIGQISIPKDIGKLIGLFSRDILEDFLKEHSADYNAIEKNEQKILNKHVNEQAVKVIKDVCFRS